METDDQFDTLSTVLEQFDARGWPVRHVEATLDGPDGAEEGPLSVSIEVPVGLPRDDGTGPQITPDRATVTGDGDLRIDCRVPDGAVPGADHPAVTLRDRSARLDDDGSVLFVLDLGVRPPTESESGPGEAVVAGRGRSDARTGDDGRDRTTETSASDDGRDRTTETSASDDGRDRTTGADESDRSTALAAVRDESVPPYEDTEYLRHLYETCDTFSDMSRIIEMDVAAETVRRYMIDAGIHDPDSYDTAREDRSTDGGPGTADGELVADGIGLPEDVDRETLIAAVVDAKTVYEVRRELGLDSSRARKLLRELGLLDLVCGRIDEDPANRTTREQVTARLQQSAGDRSREAPTH